MVKEVRNFNRRYAKEYNLFRTIFFMSFLYIVVYGFYTIFYNYKIEGRENLPEKQKIMVNIFILQTMYQYLIRQWFQWLHRGQ